MGCPYLRSGFTQLTSLTSCGIYRTAPIVIHGRRTQGACGQGTGDPQQDDGRPRVRGGVQGVDREQDSEELLHPGPDREHIVHVHGGSGGARRRPEGDPAAGGGPGIRRGWLPRCGALLQESGTRVPQGRARQRLSPLYRRGRQVWGFPHPQPRRAEDADVRGRSGGHLDGRLHLLRDRRDVPGPKVRAERMGGQIPGDGRKGRQSGLPYAGCARRPLRFRIG